LIGISKEAGELKFKERGLSTMKRRIELTLPFLLGLLGVVLLVTNLNAQTDANKTATQTSTSTSADLVNWGDYNIISSAELGVRGVRVRGDVNKYRADVNYQPGFRIFDSSFLARANDGEGGLFDSFVINSSGWDADPSGSLRVNAEKHKWYELDTNFRRSVYDNRLVNLALGQHNRFTKHKFGDADLRLLPENRNIRFNLGYSFDRDSGPMSTTYDYARDEFPISSTYRTRADEYRAGIDGSFKALDFSILQGYRYIRDDTVNFSTGFNPGNNLTNTSFLSTLRQDNPTRTRVQYTRLNLHTKILNSLDITGRYGYNKASSSFGLVESITGRNQSNQTIVSDIVVSPGRVDRPSHTLDIGATYQITDKLRLSNTFRYITFDIEGAHNFSERLFLRTAAGAPVANSFPAVTNIRPTRTLDYSRYLNQIEGDYQFGPRLSFHLGYRYSDREVREEAFGNILAPTTTFTREGEFRNDTHTFLGGFKARPIPQWNIYFDFSHGESDNVFTRVDAYESTYFRLRNRITPRRNLNINLSFISRDNNNPGDLDVTLPVQFQGLDVEIDNRIFTSTVDWSPNEKFSLSTGYTHMNMSSDVGIIFFLTNRNAPLAGRSIYYMRDNYFFFNTTIQPYRWATLFLGYNVHKDTGQGDRASQPAPEIFIRSQPLRFQSPEARLALRLHNRLDFNLGYQYFDYKDKVTSTQDFRYFQAYRAHLPYASLRFYLGRADR
jgi:hypothetical protein